MNNFFLYADLIFFRYDPRTALARSYAETYVENFQKYLYFFHDDCTSLYSPQ